MAKEFYLGLKIEDSLGEQIQNLAETDRRSVSDYVRGILLDHVQASGRINKSQAAKLKKLAKNSK